ncbi:MAG TPA: sensor histidine kinase [Candidatus Kryptonia bacterium]|nr:sensor histidine kinase [Candidatus Kryptonia bacterium]
MWARVVQIALRGHIQYRRLRAAAYVVLLVRFLEGGACWAIVYWFYGGLTVPNWAVHTTFAGYVAANLFFFALHRREALSSRLVWLDVVINVLPMALAAHWTGGVYSPLVPTFVLKIVSYGLIYGVDIGWQCLAVTLIAAAGLIGLEQNGLGPSEALERVPLIVRQRLTLGFEGLIFGIIIGGGLRFFRILQDREMRLATTAEQNSSLYQESLQYQGHLRRLSQKMMQVSERMMRRIARELHDDLGQALTAVRLDLGLVARELPPDSSLRPRVAEAREQIGTVLQSVRSLAQLLRPAVLDDLGLVPAMQSFIARFSERTGIAVAVDASPVETRLPRTVEVALYRVLQEALTNVARHAEAHHVSVNLLVDAETAQLEIRDDGRGFDAKMFLQGPTRDNAMGVIGMRERVATYGGRFTIDSRRGEGTCVALAIPLARAAESDEDYGEDPRLVG